MHFVQNKNKHTISIGNRVLGVLALMCSTLWTTIAVAELSSTVIGRGSLVRDCYDRSQQAVISRSATRGDIDVCNRAIADGAILSAELAASYSNRGVLHMAMENYSQAYKDYDRALEIDDELAEAYINRGNLWFAVQQYERAIADYGRALEFGTSQEAVAYLNRGLAYEKSGDMKSAKNDILSSLNVKPEWELAQDKLERLEKKIKTISDDR